MKNKYLILGPLGNPLVRCNDMGQAERFINKCMKIHANPCRLLMHKEIEARDYHIIHLDTVEVFEE